MARRYYSSVAVATTLASDVNNVETSIQVSSLTGFPAQAPFTIIVDQDQPTEEVMEVTNVASLVLTVARGIDGTSAVAHTTGAIVRHGVSARDFDEANAHVNDSSTDVHSQYVLKATATTAGDLLVRDSSGVTRLPVGSSGQVLTVDESAGSKMKWETPTGVSPGDTIPTGTLMPYVGDTAPTGWLLCQGQEVSQVSYPNLFSLCSTKFGSASAGFFKLPDLRGRTVFGFLSTDSNFNAVGKTGGAGSVTISTDNMPSHTHSTPNHNHTASTSGLTASSAGDHGHTISTTVSSGGDHGHTASTSIGTGGGHSHDTMLNTTSTYDRTGGGNGSAWVNTANGNLTNSSGSHSHTATTTLLNAGSHAHTATSSAVTTGSHTHSISGNVTVNSGGASTTGSAGSGSSMSVLNPFVSLNFIIKAA